MANEEHLKWLREGVEAWNKRRRNNFFEADLREAMLESADLANIELSIANLSGAVIRYANLRNADLTTSFLDGADLTGADLTQAVLSPATARHALLNGATLYDCSLDSTNLTGANVKTIYSRGSSNNDSKIQYTNLGIASGLTQEQLDSMIGDSGTIIPDHLTRPDHWEVLPWHRERAGQDDPETDDAFEDTPQSDPEPDGAFEDVSRGAPAEKPRAYYQQLALNLTREPIKSATVLEAYGQQLATATRMYRDTHQMIPDDVILIEQIASTMIHMATAVQSETAELEERIKELEEQITTLNETIKIQAMALNNGDQTVKTALIVAAGTAVLTPICTAAGASILEASSYVFGQGSDAFQGLYDTIKNHFAVRPPEPPSGTFTDV